MKRIYHYIPLIFIQFFLSLVLLLFVYGPWPWPISSKNPVYIYLLFYQLAIFFGYFLAEKKMNSNQNKIVPFFNIKKLEIILLISLIINCLTQVARTGSIQLNFLGVFDDLGDAYSETMEGRNPLIEYLRYIFCVSLFCFIPYCLYSFKRMKLRLKILFIVAFYFHITTYILMGTNKGLFDLIIIIPWLYFIYNLKNYGFLNIRSIMKKIPFFLILFTLVFLFFTKTQLERGGSVGIDAVQNMGTTILKADQNKPDFMSAEVYLGYLAMTRYLTHGYYAFSNSFEIEYSNTFPFGNSMFLARNINSFFGTKFYTENSFPGQLEKYTGWSYYEQWHSYYSWIISDFGHEFTIIIMFILGYWFAVYWIKSIYSNQPLNFIKFLVLLILFMYIPGNNQLFQNGETTFLFLGLFFFRPIIKFLNNNDK